VLVLPASDYARAFDAAVAIASERGAATSIRDRRSGLIESEPVIAPTLIEPWYWPRSTTKHVVSGTLAFERRRMRCVFSASGSETTAATGALLTGPDTLGSLADATDLTRHEGTIELRVWVFLERASQPGQRRNTWTRKATSQSRVYPPDAEDPPLPDQHWEVVSRDPETERRILDAIARHLADGQAGRTGELSDSDGGEAGADQSTARIGEVGETAGG
jgi:hypothetical protein